MQLSFHQTLTAVVLLAATTSEAHIFERRTGLAAFGAGLSLRGPVAQAATSMDFHHQHQHHHTLPCRKEQY